VELGGLAAAKDLPATMTVRGRRIFAADFSAPSLGSDWYVVGGKWLVREGALTAEPSHGSEHATIRKDLEFTDAVLQFDFKLSAGSFFHLSINGVHGHGDHLVRVIVDEKGFQIRKDGSKTDSSDAHRPLARASVELKPGTWHTMVVEILGDEVLARIGDGAAAFGSDPKIARPKGSFGFPTAGNAVLIDNVAVWQASANPGWKAAKAKLQTGAPQPQ
jgi:hypothetical protein